VDEVVLACDRKVHETKDKVYYFGSSHREGLPPKKISLDSKANPKIALN